MISFKQFITEWSYVPPSINQILKSKGYKLLGKGADQFAYLEPETGHVLKIFGTKNSDTFTRDHMMFKSWVNYCENNSTNQFLPKFYGWEGFELGGRKFLQIRMEKLQNLPLELAKALHEWADFIDRHPTTQRIDKILDNLQDLNDEFNPVGQFLTAAEVKETEKLMILLGEKQFRLFLNTIADLSRIAKSSKYHFDLHGRNFMHRNDGIPIIVDPWVV